MSNNQPMLVLHFDKSLILPPSTTWSLTMYNADDFKPAHSLNNSSPDVNNKLKFNDDGSLDIFIQEKDLAQVTDPNCLPSPNGQFFLVMRMSWPDMKKANGTPVKLAG